MNEKKLGIITFNRASNYGAILQAYALKCVCEELGYEVHVINYLKGMEDDEPTPLRDFLTSTDKKRAIFKLCRSSLSYLWDQKRWKAFVAFRKKYLDESVICSTKEDVVALGYDVYVIGSDQIWNYNITGNEFDPVYFGDFATDANCIVYAASSHDVPFPLDKELEFKEMLQRTSAKIGIREKKLADYVSVLTGVSYPVVLDPTLLAGRDKMEKIVDGVILKHPYILLYQIDANPASDISVKTLEKQFGRKVYTMTVPRLGSVHGRRGTAGPEKFLALLKNADFLVTNSFHGIALSLLFEKQFFVYDNNGVMSRIDSLLETLGLHHRKVKMVADIDCSNIIDYVSVKECLAQLRTASMCYLENALSGKQNVIQKEITNFKLPLFRERKKADCSGCSACVSLCPVGAITLKNDEEGFWYPQIVETKCIHCGRCDSICGFVPQKWEDKLPKAYGIKHKDEHIRTTSRSGAAFVAFSDIILQRDGVVYGASMQADHTVSHIRAVDASERDRMKTAKYVQSSVTGMFDMVAQDLQNGKDVLFSGTPCQISGLLTFLKAKTVDCQKLYTCDLVCHGVPSPKVWRDYLQYVQEKYGETIEVAHFRDKDFGWDSHCESFVLNSGKKIVSRDYTDLFYDHIMLRPSCHNCYFANIRRVADLTLADFWGIEKNNPDFDDNKGVSLVLVNSKKGSELLQQALSVLEWFECDVKNCIQPTLVKPSIPSGRRDAFWADYDHMSFGMLLKKYTTPLAPLPKMKRTIKQLMHRLKLRKHP